MNFENHQQASCLGKWMDQRNSLFQCSEQILARRAAAQRCCLAGTRGFAHKFPPAQ